MRTEIQRPWIYGMPGVRYLSVCLHVCLSLPQYLALYLSVCAFLSVYLFLMVTLSLSLSTSHTCALSFSLSLSPSSSHNKSTSSSSEESKSHLVADDNEWQQEAETLLHTICVEKLDCYLVPVFVQPSSAFPVLQSGLD